jgi:DNA-binding transcriptional LysR family regulator
MDVILPGSDYSQLRAFIAVAEALSFSRAAEALGITPSALSQTIRGLEESIGIQLLNRTTRSVSLTAAGENLFHRVKPAISELGEAVAKARLARERPAGTVRVHAFRSGAARYIEPMLPDFLRSHPEIVIDIALDDEAVNVVAAGFDVSLRIGEVIEQDMIAVRIGPEMRQIAVASPGYIEKYGAPDHPRELLGHRCIRWRWPGQLQPYAWEFFEAGRWFGVTVDGPLIVNDKELARRAAVNGIGIAFCTEEVVAGDLAAGRLVPLLEAWSEPFPGYFLCYPRQRQMAPALRAFIDAIRQA